MFTPIQKIPLTKLLTLSHNKLLNDVINTLKKFDLDAMRLKDSLDMLMQLKPQLKKLEVSHGKHPLTKEMKVKEERRLKLCGIISTKMQLHMRADAVGERKAVKLTQHIVNRFIVGIRKNNQDVISELIIRFFRQIDEEKELQEAFAELGFQTYLDELRDVNVTHWNMFMERNRSVSKRIKWEDKLIVKKNCQAVLRNVFDTIELKQMLYPDIDYNHLIDLLNGILVRFNKNINTRETYNKKRAEQAEQQTRMLSVDGEETGSVIIDEKSKEKIEKNKARRTRKKIIVDENDKANIIENKPQKKDGVLNGLFDILKLPPGG
jgi:hypothetical protein